MSSLTNYKLFDITVQCDSTLLASIIIGIFVTGGQYSSQMRAVSLSQLTIDVLGCGDPSENVTQNVTLSKLTGTMGALHGLGRDALRPPCRLCMCLLDVV